jgi:DUF1009 family protein
MDSICIIAGSGMLPFEVVKALDQNNIKYTIMIFDDIDYGGSILNHSDVIKIKIAKVGHIISEIKSRNIKNVVMVGGIKTPNLSAMIPDYLGSKLLANIAKSRIKGDNQIINCIEEFLNDHDINLVSVVDIAPNIANHDNCNSDEKTYKIYRGDIEIGVNFLNTISRFDVGQSVVVSDGRILGMEDVYGTENLIKRFDDYADKKSKKKPILIKMPKLGQNMKIDIPTIGYDTIEQLKRANFGGLCISRNGLIILEKEKIMKNKDIGVVFA